MSSCCSLPCIISKQSTGVSMAVRNHSDRNPASSSVIGLVSKARIVGQVPVHHSENSSNLRSVPETGHLTHFVFSQMQARIDFAYSTLLVILLSDFYGFTYIITKGCFTVLAWVMNIILLGCLAQLSIHHLTVQELTALQFLTHQNRYSLEPLQKC